MIDSGWVPIPAFATDLGLNLFDYGFIGMQVKSDDGNQITFRHWTLMLGTMSEIPDSVGPWPENLVVNGGYDADVAWTNGDGWSIAGGVAVGVPAASIADQSQPVVLPAGRYRCEYKVVSRSAGQVRFLFRGGTGAETSGALRNAVGTYVEEISTATQAIFAMRKTTTFNGSIDNVKLSYLGP